VSLSFSSQIRVPRSWRSFIAPRTGYSKTILIGLLLSALCPALCAQSQTALELAARVDRHYNALHALRVNFIQEYNGLGQHLRESGVLLLKKPGRMKWIYSQPEGKLFVLDGHDAYFYSPGQTEVQRVPAKKLDDLRSPLRFLLGHSELAKELTGLTLTPQGENYDLAGVPKNMEQRVTSLRFTVSSDGSILGIRVEEVDGSVSTFTFTGEAPNPPASDADFVFHAPAGTEIVDGLPPA
jgi:outer membrane lipoprotein carrier protein